MQVDKLTSYYKLTSCYKLTSYYELADCRVICSMHIHPVDVAILDDVSGCRVICSMHIHLAHFIPHKLGFRQALLKNNKLRCSAIRLNTFCLFIDQSLISVSVFISCHSCHIKPSLNLLCYSKICEMLKMTAT